MAQDIDKLIPDSAKQDLADVGKLWDDIVLKVTGYVKEVQRISISPDATRTLLSMDESLNKIAISTRNYEKALQAMAAAQQQTLDATRQLTQAKRESNTADDTTMGKVKGVIGVVKELAGYVDKLRENKAKLTKETGASVSMWKTLGTSLGSVTGMIGLAITVIASLTEELFKNKGAALDAENAIKAYQDRIKGINENKFASAGKDLADFKILYSIATTSSTTADAIMEQDKAVKTLKQNYSETFGQFSDADIKAGKAFGTIQQLTNAILDKSRAEATGQEVAARGEEILKLYQAENKAIKELEIAKQKAEAITGTSNLSRSLRNSQDNKVLEIEENISDIKSKRIAKEQQLTNVVQSASNFQIRAHKATAQAVVGTNAVQEDANDKMLAEHETYLKKKEELDKKYEQRRRAEEERRKQEEERKRMNEEAQQKKGLASIIDSYKQDTKKNETSAPPPPDEAGVLPERQVDILARSMNNSQEQYKAMQQKELDDMDKILVDKLIYVEEYEAYKVRITERYKKSRWTRRSIS